MTNFSALARAFANHGGREEDDMSALDLFCGVAEQAQALTALESVG